jgi:hypothetical protein
VHAVVVTVILTNRKTGQGSTWTLAPVQGEEKNMGMEKQLHDEHTYLSASNKGFSKDEIYAERGKGKIPGVSENSRTRAKKKLITQFWLPSSSK